MSGPIAKRPAGRPSDKRRDRYVKKYAREATTGLRNLRRIFPNALMDQLDGCKDESARRVLMGKGRPRNG